MKNKKILIVGSFNTFYIRSYIDFFVLREDYQVSFMNTNTAFKVDEIEGVFEIINLSEFQGLKNKKLYYLPRILLSKLGLSDSLVLRKLSYIYRYFKNKKSSKGYKDRLISLNPDIVFCFWGTTISPYIDTLKESLENSKFVLSINTYPVTFNEGNRIDDSLYFNKLKFTTACLFVSTGKASPRACLRAPGPSLSR